MSLKTFVAVCCLLLHIIATAQPKSPRPRTVITTDGEVDDQDSFIRLLLYANEFDIVGLVYSSSQWHYAGDGKGTAFTSEMPYTAKRYGERKDLRWPGTEWMQHHIGNYARVYANLIKHSKKYPSPDYLLSMIKVGNIDFEGEMEKHSAGAGLIKNILLDSNPAPVYLQIWGGTNTVARALKSIEEEFKGTPKWEDTYRKVSEKAVIYTVLDQDATYQKYIAPNWPRIKVLYNSGQFWSFAYPWPQVVPHQLQRYLKGKWFKEHIKYNHGPLMAGYFLWGDQQKITGDPEHTQGDISETTKNGHSRYDFISEGDSPAFFYLLDVGLRSLEDASYGGWGGRMIHAAKDSNRWEDGEQVVDYDPFTNETEISFPQTRWTDVLQNDFAARANWCVKSYQTANHAPVVKLNHAHDLMAGPGEKINLSGFATDPDKNSMVYKWWQYEEVGTYKGKIVLLNSTKQNASFTVPKDAGSGNTIHIILQATDSGIPALTRYQRVIVKIP